MGSITLEGVSKSFGAVEVISRLSLSIRDGEFVAFLGPSGCGKSTLLRMIAGLEAVDDGEIRIGERRVDHLPPGRRGVAMVFQHYALYPHMTIYENAAFGLRNIGLGAGVIDQRVRRAAGMLEIVALLDRKPGELSGGQRQRAAIARALVKEPEVFLFDEPLSNLDAALRLRTRVELARLHQRMRATTIFVTHDQIEAMTMAERIVVMHERAIQQIGDPMEVYARPATEFVASFVGSPSMNLLDARVWDDEGRAVVELPGGARLATAIPMAGLRAGQPARFGVRAEAVRIDPEGPVRGCIEVIERLGDRTHLHVRGPGDAVVVAEDGGRSRARVGDTVGLGFAMDEVHLFDAAGQGHHVP